MNVSNPPFLRFVFWIITLAVTFSAVVASAENFRIGVSLPLASNAAKLSEQFLDGMRLAIRTESSENSFELFVIDDGCDREIGGLAAEDLQKSGVALTIGYFCSEPAEVAAELLREIGVPIVVTGARSVRLIKDRQKHGWNLWRASPGDDYPADAAFRELSKRWKNIPYAIVDDGTIYGRTLVDEFRSRMEDVGVPPLFIDNFRAAQSTQAGLIRRLQRSGVKAAFIGASSDDLFLIVRNINQLGADFEIAGGEVMNILPYLINSEPVPEGLLAILEPEPDTMDQTASLRKLLDESSIQGEPFFYKGYAAMQIAMQAVKSSHEKTIENLNSAIFKTVLGEVKFDEQGRNIHNRFALYSWNGEKFMRISGENISN